MTPIVIIPARMGASRLPGKPLADIGGQPMIVRVMRAALTAHVGPVVVAASEPEVAAAARSAGGEAVLTPVDLPSGSDRVKAALLDLDARSKYDVVVNLQGDMPFVDPQLLRACVELLDRDSDCDIATAAALETSPRDRTNPDVVKAIISLRIGGASGRALYFTRSTLFGEGPVWRHVGIYAYRREALSKFCGAAPSDLERREKLEQLRALELGLSIHVAITPTAPLSVDTPADLAEARTYARGLAAA